MDHGLISTIDLIIEFFFIPKKIQSLFEKHSIIVRIFLGSPAIKF